MNKKFLLCNEMLLMNCTKNRRFPSGPLRRRDRAAAGEGRGGGGRYGIPQEGRPPNVGAERGGLEALFYSVIMVYITQFT